MDSIKLYTTNFLVIMFSFSNVENLLKIILLLLSIVYTTFKLIESYKKNKDK
jgi:hypothetical protein